MCKVLLPRENKPSNLIKHIFGAAKKRGVGVEQVIKPTDLRFVNVDPKDVKRLV